MQKTHYLKREKKGQLIQLLLITQIIDEFGSHLHSVKYDVDPEYKKVFSYLRYPIPHEELTEISFAEFRELCGMHNCLATTESAVPGYPQSQSSTQSA